jgi:undecaprenyl-phosphate 4-deoxy-4-formamido-L-arabinose transferase
MSENDRIVKKEPPSPHHPDHPEKSTPEISVVVPVFNSETTLERLYEEVSEAMEAAGLTYELVLVDDGSTDQSWTRITELKARHGDQVTGLRLGRNFGQHNATLAGIHAAAGRLIITLDDDLQTPPSEISKLLELHRTTDCMLAYGIYPSKKHTWFRNLGSSLLKRLFRHLVNGVRDGSSFRLITRNLADKLQGTNQPFVFIDQVLSWHTGDVEFVDVDHRERTEGKSGYSTRKLFRLALNIIFSYTDLPLRLMTWFGFITSLVSFVIGGYFIYQKLVYGAAIGFTALIVSIFFSTSLIVFFLGILGEYIGRIYASRGDRPNYSIKSRL